MAGEDGNEQVTVAEKALDHTSEQAPEEQVPISKVNNLTSVLQRQTAAEAARARAAEERAASIEAERNDLAAKIKALEEDITLAHESQDGFEGEKKAEQEIVKRLNKLRVKEQDAEARSRKAQESEQRATERERKAAARELAVQTGANEEDLLKHKDIHEMTAAALKFQVDALTAQLTGKAPPQSATRKPGEFDLSQSNISGPSNWKAIQAAYIANPTDPQIAARYLAARRAKGL